MPDLNNITPSFGAFFLQQDGDLSKCTRCEDQLFGKMYTLQTEISDGENTVFNGMPVKLCQSCYESHMGVFQGPENI